MKVLFAFFSLEGSCRELSRYMAEAVGGETAELVPATGAPPRGTVMKYLAGGLSSIKQDTIELRPLAVEPREYDLVIVGGPVWAWRMTPAVRSFLSGRDWAGMKTAVFSMYRGAAGSVCDAMAKIIEEKGGEVLGTGRFVDLHLRRSDVNKTRRDAVAWVADMMAKVGPGAV